MVKQYELEVDDHDGWTHGAPHAVAVPSASGDWVSHDDYAALETVLAEARVDLRVMRESHDKLAAERVAHADEVARLLGHLDKTERNAEMFRAQLADARLMLRYAKSVLVRLQITNADDVHELVDLAAVLLAGEPDSDDLATMLAELECSAFVEPGEE